MDKLNILAPFVFSVKWHMAHTIVISFSPLQIVVKKNDISNIGKINLDFQSAVSNRIIGMKIFAQVIITYN